MSLSSKAAGVVLLVLVAALVCAQGGAAQEAAPVSAQRGFESVTPDQTVKNGHQYVVAIGIDHYANWPILSTAVSDATGFSQLLTSKFGFENVVEPLTEKRRHARGHHFADRRRPSRDAASRKTLW